MGIGGRWAHSFYDCGSAQLTPGNLSFDLLWKDQGQAQKLSDRGPFGVTGAIFIIFLKMKGPIKAKIGLPKTLYILSKPQLGAIKGRRLD